MQSLKLQFSPNTYNNLTSTIRYPAVKYNYLVTVFVCVCVLLVIEACCKLYVKMTAVIHDSDGDESSHPNAATIRNPCTKRIRTNSFRLICRLSCKLQSRHFTLTFSRQNNDIKWKTFAPMDWWPFESVEININSRISIADEWLRILLPRTKKDKWLKNNTSKSNLCLTQRKFK